MSEVAQKFFWKGKLVTKRVHELRCKQVENGKKIRKIEKEKSESGECSTTKIETKPSVIEGRRIIHPQTLANELFCCKCNAILSLLDCVTEKKSSLASTFYVQCRLCKAITMVNSDKSHEGPSKRAYHDINTKAVVGCLHSGMGCSHLNKLLAALNVPEYNWQSFKNHENEVGLAVEQLAQESCLQAVHEERQLTIANIHSVEKML